MKTFRRLAVTFLLFTAAACAPAAAGSTSPANNSPVTAPAAPSAFVPGPSPEAKAPVTGAVAHREPAQSAAGPSTAAVPATKGQAYALLETLAIKGRAPMTGYDRDHFGPAWADVDRNGCDTRNDMLGRQLMDVIYANRVPCKVSAGTLADPYTGNLIRFVRGQDTSWQVQIDHVVALGDAWQKGAQQLSYADRLRFANDPLNLQATDGPINGQKGAGDAATWLPPNKAYRCEYVARQTSVKAAYRLWVTQTEYDAMARVLAGCGDYPAPVGSIAPVGVHGDSAPSSLPPAAPTPGDDTPARNGPESVYYANCTAVRAAGAAPIHAGHQGWSTRFDGDGDGVGCE